MELFLLKVFTIANNKVMMINLKVLDMKLTKVIYGKIGLCLRGYTIETTVRRLGFGED